MKKWSGALALALTLGAVRDAQAINDPSQDYYTLETPHFRIHYPRVLEPVADDVADTMEEVHERMVPVLGHRPTEVTHVLLTDGTESANGSATALPYNAVRLFATAPDDMSPLADYDDWFLELTTHEYTHILHIDNISGLPALLNVVLGKTSAPNQLQPRWILEGLAVLEESEHTSGGRNRSAIFDMYLRANVLEDRIAGLDRISHGPRRWPMGNFWYLYGSRFLTWIHKTYGEHTMRTIAADYGKQIIPFGINRSIRRATGRTYEELYDGWKQHLQRLYKDQIDKATAQGGLREGHRLTHHGRTTARPRWVPQGVRRAPKIPEVLYYLEDGHHRPGFHRLFVPNARESWESDRDLWVRTAGEGSASFSRDGALFFSSLEPHKKVYSYSDLFRLGAGKASPDGDEPERERLSEAQRAIDPDARFDGRQLTFAINRRGTQYLAVADLNGDGTMEGSAGAGAVGALPAGVHASLRAGWAENRVLVVVPRGVPGYPGRGRQDRPVLRAEPRPGDGHAALVVARREDPVFFLGSHGDSQHLRARSGDRKAVAGHQRTHGRVHAGGVAGRPDDAVRRVHLRRL